MTIHFWGSLLKRPGSGSKFFRPGEAQMGMFIFGIIYIYIYIIRSKWSGYPILTHTQMSKIQGLWHDDTLTWIVYWVSATKICSTNQTVEHLDFTKISEIWRVVMIMSQDWSSWLVVLPLNRKMKVSWDDEIPNMGKSIQIPWFQSPPTSPGIYSYFIQMASVLSVLNPVILNR